MRNADSRSFQYYIETCCEHEMLTPAEEVALSKRAMNGDETAVEELVLKNQQFVVSIAKEFLGRGIAIEDLCQEGNIGLLTAARKFDHARGFRFITYAVWWIRQAMQRQLAEQSKPVRLPAGTAQRIGRAMTANKAHFRKTGQAAPASCYYLYKYIKVLSVALQYTVRVKYDQLY